MRNPGVLAARAFALALVLGASGSGAQAAEVFGRGGSHAFSSLYAAIESAPRFAFAEANAAEGFIGAASLTRLVVVNLPSSQIVRSAYRSHGDIVLSSAPAR